MNELSLRFSNLSEGRRELLRQVLDREGLDGSRLPIRPRRPDTSPLPLSYAQESVWFLSHLAEDSAVSSPWGDRGGRTHTPSALPIGVFNLPLWVRLRGALDLSALKRTLDEIARRHEILRTVFPATAGKPRQEILSNAVFPFSVVDCADPPTALRRATQESRRAFDVAAEPPLRAVLYRLAADDHLLLLVFHHLVWDGWSIGIFTREMAALYDAFTQGRPSSLPEPSLQYADYALWQRQWLQGEVLDRQLAFWRRQLDGYPDDLDLPTDRPRPAALGFAGSVQTMVLPRSTGAGLEALSQETGATLYMTLLAAFQVLLARYSGGERIAVGTPVANRRRQECEGLIGYLANIVVMPTDLAGDPTFREVIARVRETTTAVYAHQDVPFEMLVRELNVARDAGRNPIFQVMFAMHQETIGSLKLTGLQAESVELDTEITHFDLGLHLWHREGVIHGYASYNKDLFDPSTITRLLSHYRVLLAAIIDDPGRRIGSLPLLTAPERQWLSERGPPDVAEITRHRNAAGEPVHGPLQVLDGRGELQPIGVPGTVHVADPEGRLSATPERGRWLAAGTLELLGTDPRWAWRDGVCFELAEIEAVLTEHRAVDSCRVLTRLRRGCEQQVAYVVPAQPASPGELREHLASRLPASRLPAAWVEISRLPVSPQGEIDDRALAALPVIDEDLVKRWQRRLESVSGIERVCVVARESTPPRPLLHVSELVPEGRFGGAVEEPAAGRPQPETSVETASGPLALADGGPLTIAQDAPRTLTEALLASAEKHADRGLTLVQDEGAPALISYRELLATARRILTGLRAAGLGPGDRVILQLDDLADHFAAFWGCVLGGVAPVTVATAPTHDRRSSVLNKLWNVRQLLAAPIVTQQRLLAPLSGVPALYCEEDGEPEPLRLLAVERLRQESPAEKIHDAAPEDVAFLQLTSGSTGVPKCIRETHDGIIHHVHGSRQFNGYGSDDVTLNWLPPDHVVPILTCHLKDVCLGIRQIHVKTDQILARPLRWLDLIAEHRVTHTWSPNFGFKLVTDALAKEPDRRWDLGSVKAWMNAGEQVTVPVMAEFLRRTAPFGVAARAVQPAFGMAEVCTCMTYTNDFDLEETVHRVRKSSLGGRLEEAAGEEGDAIPFVDLGPPMPGVEIRIADGSGRTLPESLIGRFQIRGAVTTPGYLYNEEANREAFVGDGWFNSGDLGFLRNGRLTLTGREKEMIIVRGANFYCYEIEDVVNAVDGVLPTFAAACSVDDPETGSEGLAVFFVPRQPGIDVDLIRRIREQVARDLGVAPAWVIPLERQSFPKTTSGKIQRTQLKDKLSAGEYADLLKRIDLALENQNTLPAWFYRWGWQRQEPVPAPAADVGAGLRARPTRSTTDDPPDARPPSAPAPQAGRVTLLFDDETGLGEALAELLGDEQVVRVCCAGSFSRLGARHYTIAPGNGEHYEQLFGALAETGVAIDQVVHLWTWEERPDAPARDRDRGVTSLFHLGRALVRKPGERPLRLLVAASGCQRVADGDQIVWERTAVLGLLKTLGRELSSLDCRHVDLPVGDPGAAAESLLRELRAVAGGSEAAWRDGCRWVPQLERASLDPARELPFRRRALVLISGGLGGIGAELSRYLLRHCQARLLLIGRSPLDGDPAISDEATSVDSLAAGRSAAERRRTFEELTRLGEVIYEAVDVADPDAVRTAVARAEQRWGTQLDGVVHLAGVFPTRLVSEQTAAELAATLRPKLEGTRVLDQLLGDDGFLIAFGSVYGSFGAVAGGAYAAANRALEAFVEQRRQRGGERSYCFAWSHWEDLGMSRGYLLGEQAAVLGYEMIEPRRAILSLLAGLRAGHPRLLIGLDERTPNVRRHLEAPLVARRRLTAYYRAAPEASSELAERCDFEIQDGFGTPSRCELVEVDRMPLTAAGEIDVAQLAGLAPPDRAAAERVAPRTSLERTIAGIWREILPVDKIGIHDSFFAVGGQSILLAQVLTRLQQVLKRELAIVELLRYPTISTLAQHLGEKAAPLRARDQAAERARKQKQVPRRRIRPRRKR